MDVIVAVTQIIHTLYGWMFTGSEPVCYRFIAMTCNAHVKFSFHLVALRNSRRYLDICRRFSPSARVADVTSRYALSGLGYKSFIEVL